MDRSAFFSSLPFLLPTHFDSFPSSEEYSVDVLLNDNFFLSVESESSNGPTFFASEESTDPARASIELALLHRLVDDGDNNESLMSMSIGAAPTRPNSYESLGLLIRTNGSVYAVDARKLRKIKFERRSLEEAEDRRPASMLLHFNGGCCFRIYSQYEEEDALKLEDVHARLDTLLRENRNEDVWKLGLHFLDSSSIDSPSTATASHPNESQGSSTTVEENNNNSRKRKGPPVPEGVPPVVRKLKDREQHYLSAQRSLSKLKKISQHISSVPHNDVPEYRQATFKLMTAAAKSIGRSFVSPLDVQDGAAHFTTLADAAAQKADRILEQHFSTKSCTTGGTSNISDQSLPAVGIDSLLKERRRLVLERTKLLLYATRG